MTQQLINLGTTDNDGTGDPLRVAGGKINQNFAEVYGSAAAAQGTADAAQSAATSAQSAASSAAGVAASAASAAATAQASVTALAATVAALPSAQSHRRYVFHGFAGGNQILGDPALFDISGNINHAYPGSDLSNANLWANAGYASTVDPAGGTTDSVLRMGRLNYDYNGGEKLIVWWLGKVTAEGSAVEMMGDGIATVSAGVSLRINTNGTHQLLMSDGTTNLFSGSSTVAVANGALHSIAFAIDGATRGYCLWSDEVAFSNNADYQLLSSGTPADTRNANSWNIGSARPKSAASTTGIATQTRALAMLRLAPSDAMPSVAALTNIFRALRAAPNRVIRDGAF
jgi:hypothetical protein